MNCKYQGRKKYSKIIQTMMEYRHCVCVPPQAPRTPNGLDRQRQRQITKRFNSKQQHSSVRYMKNIQSEVSQDG